METYQTLSIESFSYSWLANMNPSSERPGHSFRDSLDAYDEASFIEMDPQLSSSKRFFKVSQEFDFPISQAPTTLVHADELIFNGFIMPVFVKQVKEDVYDAPDPTKTSPGHSAKESEDKDQALELEPAQQDFMEKKPGLVQLQHLREQAQRTHLIIGAGGLVIRRALYMKPCSIVKEQ